MELSLKPAVCKRHSTLFDAEIQIKAVEWIHCNCNELWNAQLHVSSHETSAMALAHAEDAIKNNLLPVIKQVVERTYGPAKA